MLRLFSIILLAPLISFASSTSAGGGWQIGVGGGLHLNPRATFNNLEQSNISGDLSAEIEYNNYLAASVELRNLPANSWGFLIGLFHELEHEQSDASVTINGSTFSASGDSKLQNTVIYWSAAYRGDEFYLPFGLNYSFPKFTPSSNSTATEFEASGGGGIQFGFGVYAQPQIVLEGLLHATALKLKGRTATYTFDYNTGYVTSASLGIKYFF